MTTSMGTVRLREFENLFFDNLNSDIENYLTTNVIFRNS